MPELNESHWEEIALNLHGETTDNTAQGSNTSLSEESIADLGKAAEIRADLLQAGPFPSESKQQSWQTIEKKIRLQKLVWIRTILKYAAIIAITLGVSQLLHSNLAEKALHYSEVFVPFGQMTQLTLSDGTEVWLNSGTSIRYPEQFASSERKVQISGEAFFKVKKMSGKPFIVNSRDLNIKVLGTSFNISAYKEDAAASVTLVEGKVAVIDTLENTIAGLQPNQMLIRNKNTNTYIIRNVKTSFYSQWTEGKIYFDDERLDQIAAKLNRWFNVEIIFANEQLKSYRCSGTILKNKPVDQIMQAFELLSPISFKHQINANGKDKITIYKRS